MLNCRLSLKINFEDGQANEFTFPLPQDLADFIIEKSDENKVSASEIAVKYLARGIITEIKERRDKLTEKPPPASAIESSPSSEIKPPAAENVQEATEENAK